MPLFSFLRSPSGPQVDPNSGLLTAGGFEITLFSSAGLGDRGIPQQGV